MQFMTLNEIKFKKLDFNFDLTIWLYKEAAQVWNLVCETLKNVCSVLTQTSGSGFLLYVYKDVTNQNSETTSAVWLSLIVCLSLRHGLKDVYFHLHNTVVLKKKNLTPF